MSPGLKRTPLYAAHRRAAAKMVQFAGWEMPVQYQGIIDEHLAVRRRAGLFDVSHMGEIELRGADALEFSQRMTANDVARMSVGQAQYNLLLNERGGIIDDVIFYRLAGDAFLICVNAANIEKDFLWIQKHAGGAAVAVENVSARYCQLALQGPRAQSILSPLTSLDLRTLNSFHFVFADVAAIRCLVARTGYTGEDGFELYCDATAGARLWDALLSAGESEQLIPAGLGARDTLRLEKAYPLYGHELDDEITPLEAGLGWVTKFSKPTFLGREVLVEQKNRGLRRKLVGLELLGPGIARANYELQKQGRAIGRITSGTKSPSLGKSIALGYVSFEDAEIGNRVDVNVRGRNVAAEIVPVPFYNR
ncbi:MAG TPA: glycine cleavage system aminomethyltransferase GcvT [Candidatus Binatia bacterium]